MRAGEELRRISFMVFADTEDEGEEGPRQVQTFDAHFLGQAPVQGAALGGGGEIVCVNACTCVCAKAETCPDMRLQFLALPPLF